MYYIHKYSNGWVISDDVINLDRRLTKEEMERLKNEFPLLKDEVVFSIKSAQIRSIALAKNTYSEDNAKISEPSKA